LVQEFLEAKVEHKTDEAALKIIHPAIVKVTSDLEDQKYNTAIATMMKATNELYELKANAGFTDRSSWTFALESLVALIAPFAPHTAEELWHDLGHQDSVNKGHWPQWDEKFLASDSVTYAVQVNGKLRGTIRLAADADQAAVEAAAKGDEKVATYLTATPKKVICENHYDIASQVLMLFADNFSSQKEIVIGNMPINLN
jgi:leucyl-tRNA synthetase